jgi:two-component system alkaline phosphatase synthesis response regulator PhoP
MTQPSYILVADDDPLVLRSITFILERAGFRIQTATNGHRALDCIRKERPALAMLDVMMPDMDGLELCRQLKSDPDLKSMPVFLVTARAMKQERERGLAAGADDYITKPFQNQALIDRIREVLERSGATLPSA